MNRAGLYLFSAALLFSSALYAQKAGFISGDRILFDDKTGSTDISNARINADDGLTLTAGNASYIVDQNETPRSIELSSGIRFSSADSVGSADRGVYYPELQMLTASQIWFVAPNGRLITANSGVSYTCSSGILYANGTSTGGSSRCFAGSGGGSTVISCGGSGGNSVQMVRYRINQCSS